MSSSHPRSSSKTLTSVPNCKHPLKCRRMRVGSRSNPC
ncbi:hypothetical protein PVAP13_5NG171781 [Panicum virgatum]|uniref:Uncharacterized protein n=1 Tax=Panicum virgatum TaxID=38727 RepID=A0A8T0RSA2_PANVG|nr:hypothetical protein PVAP13_5NG171781 [Panicum virgatum]